MREGDDLFFAPEVRFSALRLEDPSALSEAYRARVEGYYLAPAEQLSEKGHAFAAGVLLLAAVDFLASFRRSADEMVGRQVGADFRAFVRTELASFRTGALAQGFYDRFRNGLIHEGRIKEAGEFSFDHAFTVRRKDGRVSVNPKYLLREVREALERQANAIARDRAVHERLAERLRDQFSAELDILEDIRDRAV